MAAPKKKTPTVADAMQAPFAAVRETDTVAAALLRMEQLPAFSLCVLSAADRWKGLVLGKQLIALRDGGVRVAEQAVSEFARPELAVSPDDSIEEAARLMSENLLARLPVVENEMVVGSLLEADARAWLGLAAKPDPAALARLSRWRPPQITSRQRAQPSGPQVERWERLLRAERSATYHLVSAAAGSRFLRTVFGLPERLAAPAGAALGEREARAAEVLSTSIGSFFSRLGARRRREQHERDRPPSRPDQRPALGPALDAELDAALNLVTSMAFEEVQERGWNVQPNHYYWPLNDLGFLRRNPQLWVRQERLHGIDLDLDGQERLAARLAAYAHELDDVPDKPTQRGREFVWENGAFPPGDAYAYYGLIRELRPRRVFEVGAGWSSLMLARAVRANADGCEVTLIDPEPDRVLGDNPERWRVLPSLLQHVDLAHFDALEARDILFYDGSHCVHTASDVNWMVFEVLPRLPPGVWVHFHDITWPYDYPPGWTLDEGFSWNEQYLLQGFLMHNSAYRLRLAMTMLLARRWRQVQSLFPGELVGTSVWLEKVSD